MLGWVYGSGDGDGGGTCKGRRIMVIVVNSNEVPYYLRLHLFFLSSKENHLFLQHGSVLLATVSTAGVHGCGGEVGKHNLLGDARTR